MAPSKNRAPDHQSKKHPSIRDTEFERATLLIHRVCRLAGDYSRFNLDNPETTVLSNAIRARDTERLFAWLMVAISFQGISDRAATQYIRKHGSIKWREIREHLAKKPTCPKLTSYWHFHRCGYRKNTSSCSRPEHFSQCPLPQHDLRNGRLNQTAYALYFFIRDIMNADLVGWIGDQIKSAGTNRRGARIQSLIYPLRHVHGLGDKILAMALSDILLSADVDRQSWRDTGRNMIAVDSLVHKFLHRTGILKACGLEHTYGTKCYGKLGCAEIIAKLSTKIDARAFNPSFPRNYPRFVQHAVWRFGAQDELNICNSIKIDDRKRCGNNWCRLFPQCGRKPISP